MFSLHTHRLQSSLSTSDGKYVCLRCLSRLFVEPRESVLPNRDPAVAGRGGIAGIACFFRTFFLCTEISSKEVVRI